MKRTYGVLRGGIGNQLFQLAAYKALADRSNRELLLDVNSFSHASQLELGRKPESLELGSNRQIKSFVWKNQNLVVPTTFFHRLVRTASDRYSSNSAPMGIFASEKGKKTLKSLKGRKTFRYLDAYFGDFSAIEDIGTSLEGIVSSLIDEADARGIANSNYEVEGAIHLRMGDFLRVAPARVLDKESVSDGLAALDLPVKGRYLVFSDSPELATAALADSGIEVCLPSKGLSDLESLLLMGSSQNLVCSRSTFSWWAGQMVAKSGGRVAFPKPWKSRSFSAKTPTNWVFF